MEKKEQPFLQWRMLKDSQVAQARKWPGHKNRDEKVLQRRLYRFDDTGKLISVRDPYLLSEVFGNAPDGIVFFKKKLQRNKEKGHHD